MRLTTIAIIEDDEKVAELLRLITTREGFTPLVLRDGVAAIAFAKSEDAPAAIILDANLPYHDGFAVARAIRETPRWRTVPIVMLTGRQCTADEAVARSCGIQHYMTKPFRPSELLRVLRTLLDAQAPIARPCGDR